MTKHFNAHISKVFNNVLASTPFEIVALISSLLSFEPNLDWQDQLASLLLGSQNEAHGLRDEELIRRQVRARKAEKSSENGTSTFSVLAELVG